MVATQARRAALYATLKDTMGDEAAETLIEGLPPSGWEQMATKEDLAGVELRLRTAMAESHAELVKSHAELVESQANLQVAMERGFAAAATERAELVKSQARQLYVIVSTVVASVVLATVSIWIALFTTAGA